MSTEPTSSKPPRSQEELNIALLEAAKTGKVEDIQQLIDQGAQVTEAKDKHGHTALYLAAEGRPSPEKTAAVKLLLERGADANDGLKRDERGLTPLHRAARVGNADVVALLLEHGARADVKDEYGNTPLHKAADIGQPIRIRIPGPERPPNPTDVRHEETVEGKVQVIKMLLEKGANPDKPNDLNETPRKKASIYLKPFLSEGQAAGLFPPAPAAPDTGRVDPPPTRQQDPPPPQTDAPPPTRTDPAPPSTRTNPPPARPDATPEKRPEYGLVKYNQPDGSVKYYAVEVVQPQGGKASLKVDQERDKQNPGYTVMKDGKIEGYVNFKPIPDGKGKELADKYGVQYENLDPRDGQNFSVNPEKKRMPAAAYEEAKNAGGNGQNVVNTEMSVPESAVSRARERLHGRHDYDAITPDIEKAARMAVVTGTRVAAVTNSDRGEFNKAGEQKKVGSKIDPHSTVRGA